MKVVLSNVELTLCVNDPRELHRSLRSIFKEGAFTLEKVIIKELFRRLSLPYEEQTDFDFEAYVNLAEELHATQRGITPLGKVADTQPPKDHIIKPYLKVVKTFWQDTPVQISFVVIDLNEGQEYPQNFLCVFPRNLFRKNQRSNLKRSKFAKIFGEKTHEVARKLLQEALRKETDREARRHIESSLKEVIDSSQQNIQ
jgi:hypothetical protein